MNPTLPMPDFVALVARSLGVEAADLDVDIPLGERLALESARMIELAIVLEEELDLVLADDVDLRGETVHHLYAMLTTAANDSANR